MIYFVVSLLVADLCLLQGALLNQDGIQAADWKRHPETKTLASKINKTEDYVTSEQHQIDVDQCKADVASVTSMVARLSNDLSTSKQGISTINGKVATLEHNYNTNTVKKCISGVFSNQDSGTFSISFNPRFSSTPAFLFAVTALDSGPDTRYVIRQKSLTASSVTMEIKTWAGSWLAWLKVQYIACL